MSKNKRTLPLLLLSVLLLSPFGASLAEEDREDREGIDDIIIVMGERETVKTLPGAAHLIGPEFLDKFEYSDIQRIARVVPGVSIQIEDGYGLRPNISIRGVATERSGRITLLEDNVLIAPAPYSAPSAYYFPTIGRIRALELVKGPAAITQGPYTIGGALNMISTPIPSERDGQVLFEYGTDATARLHAFYGQRTPSGFGYLVEFHAWQSDGFQDIDRSSTSTGLEVTDYTVKLDYVSPDSRHAVELKLQQTSQDSEQSYLGLTDTDFARNAYRRYGLSLLDNISTDHSQTILKYRLRITPALTFTATAYDNRHERDWFKTEGIDFDGSPNAQNFSRTSWSNVIRALNTNTDLVSGATTVSVASLQAILDGTANTEEGSIQVRSNSREYFSRGVQATLGWQGSTGNVSHNINIGIRYHEDEEDRLQRNSTYRQLDGRLLLSDFGELGNAGNRVQEAAALAFYFRNRLEFGRWILTPGFRYEDIEQKRTRFRGGATRVFRDSRNNDTRVFLPGFGAIYAVNGSLSLFGGLHRGFTVPGNSPSAEPEEAWNYEFGLRYDSNGLKAEVTGFFSDYENLLGVCTASSGSDCEIGDVFNGDAAEVRGIEASVARTFELPRSMQASVALVYTYMDGEFQTDIADTDFFGDVSAGDPLPYIPESQYSISLGLGALRWTVNALVNYVDKVCTRASCGPFERTEDTLTVDLAGHYFVHDKLKVYGRIENLTAEESLLGRQPYGARPNKKESVSVGLEFAF